MADSREGRPHQTWLKEVVVAAQKEVHSWPDWKKPTSNRGEVDDEQASSGEDSD